MNIDEFELDEIQHDIKKLKRSGGGGTGGVPVSRVDAIDKKIVDISYFGTPEESNAVGDGVTIDDTAFARNVKYITKPNKTYRLSGSVFNSKDISGDANIIIDDYKDRTPSIFGQGKFNLSEDNLDNILDMNTTNEAIPKGALPTQQIGAWVTTTDPSIYPSKSIKNIYGWGQVFPENGSTIPANIRIFIRNYSIKAYSTVLKKWVELNDYPEKHLGDFYMSNFSDNSTVTTTKIQHGDSTSFLASDMPTGRCYHFFPYNSSKDNVVELGLTYVVTSFEARYDMDDEGGIDNRGNAKFVFNVGGDAKSTTGTTDVEIAGSRFIKMSTEYRKVTMCSLPKSKRYLLETLHNDYKNQVIIDGKEYDGIVKQSGKLIFNDNTGKMYISKYNSGTNKALNYYETNSKTKLYLPNLPNATTPQYIKLLEIDITESWETIFVNFEHFSAEQKGYSNVDICIRTSDITADATISYINARDIKGYSTNGGDNYIIEVSTNSASLKVINIWYKSNSQYNNSVVNIDFQCLFFTKFLVNKSLFSTRFIADTSVWTSTIPSGTLTVGSSISGVPLIVYGAPSSAPNFIGQEYIDTQNHKEYKATGTTSVNSWAQYTRIGGGIDTTLPGNVGTLATPMDSALKVLIPLGNCTINATGGIIGMTCDFAITTSGITSFTITWGTNFKTTSTLTTGTVDAKKFIVSFICVDGTTWVEKSRTVAM